MNKTIFSLVFVISCFCIFSGCGKKEPAADPSDSSSQALKPFESLEGTLRIAGGTAHLGVMEEARKRIIMLNPKIQITVEGGGSGVGVKKAGEGLVEIGNAGRALSEEEAEKYGLKSFAFAVDGVCPIVHPSNTVNALTTEQLKGLFAGTITNWKELGGADKAVNLYNRDKESGTRKVFWKKGLAKGEMTEKANFVKSNGAMKTGVANDPAGIGYMSIGYLEESVKAPSLDGVAATQANAINGAFKVTRKLYMNTKGAPAGLTRAFIDYILGSEGAEIVTAKGYIPIQ